MKRRPMTAEGVHDHDAYWWSCTQRGCTEKMRHAGTFDQVKRAAVAHCNESGHASHFTRQHTHVTEVREIPS